MNVDIENNSLMYNNKDCRPADFNGSLFTNSTIAENSEFAKKKKSLAANQGANQGNSLAINKTIVEKEIAKKQLLDKHNQHVNKVQMRKQTLSQNGTL
jgi:hypothetical protein